MTTETAQPAPRCTDTRADGQPCRGWAVRGQSVCRMHGADTPTTRRDADAVTRNARQLVLAERRFERALMRPYRPR